MRLEPRGLSPASRVGRAVNWLWSTTLGMKATIGYSEDRGIPELVLESSWRLRDEQTRVRAHLDLVAALARAL